jgi:hypothetical protein
MTQYYVDEDEEKQFFYSETVTLVKNWKFKINIFYIE